jgi:hypothetical protein
MVIHPTNRLAEKPGEGPRRNQFDDRGLTGPLLAPDVAYVGSGDAPRGNAVYRDQLAVVMFFTAALYLFIAEPFTEFH